MLSPSERLFNAFKRRKNSFLRTMDNMTIGELRRKEWFIFLSTNVFFPYIAVLFLQISHNFYFRNIAVLTFAFIILGANIHRIRFAQRLKKIYIVIAILNVLSVPFSGGISFFTTLNIWVFNAFDLYDMTLGDGYRRGWPFELYSHV